MKPSERVGPKGEDWSKFLKEIGDPQIQGVLGDDPLLRFNRATAREHGEHSAEEMKARILEKRKELEEFRAFTLGKWLYEKMGEHFPDGLRDRTVKDGPKEANSLGWFWDTENKPLFAKESENAVPRLMPSSKIFLAKQALKPLTALRKRFWIFGPLVEFTVKPVVMVAHGEPVVIAQQIFHWNEQEES